MRLGFLTQLVNNYQKIPDLGVIIIIIESGLKLITKILHNQHFMC